MFRYPVVREGTQKDLFITKLQGLTNAGIVKSEVEYKRYFNDILGTLNSGGAQIFNARNINIKYSDLISFKVYKKYFELIYYDLFTSYKEVDQIHEFLKTNLDKNKQFYKNINERIRYYKKYLSLIKMNTYDVTVSNKSFMESFFDNSNEFRLNNCEINTKTNQLYLKPMSVNEYTNSIDIDKVELQIIPVKNEQGGVYFTHTDKNDIVKNYEFGNRDMLRNGLWKLQILSEGVTENYININGQRKYYGVSAILDIHFTGQKPINRLFIDPYGEFYTSILSVQYWDSNSNSWKSARKYDQNTKIYNELKGENIVFDFINIEPFSTDKLRIIFNQQNYKTIDNYLNSEIDAFSTLIKEIKENRYDSVSKSVLYDRYLTKPPDNKNEKQTTLEKIYNIILETNSFIETEQKIKELLFPQIKNINYNSNWRVYELGAWKIIPQYIQFTSNPGMFISHDVGGYSIDKSPLQVTLTTKEETPELSSIEYFITDEKETKFVPITPMNQKTRRESNRMVIYPAMARSNWKTEPHIFYLDYPIQQDMLKYTKIYINGKGIELGNNAGNIVTQFNSRMFYLNGYKYNKYDNIVFEYIPAKHEMVECWILKPNNGDILKIPHSYNLTFYGEYEILYYDNGLFLDQYVTFPTKNSANEFLFYLDNTIKYYKNSYTRCGPDFESLQKSYSIKKTLCSINEFNTWFKNGVIPVFLDHNFKDIYAIDETIGTLFIPNFYPPISTYYIQHLTFLEKRYTFEYTKQSWLFDRSFTTNLPKTYFPTYFNGTSYNTWNNLIPSIMV